MALQIEDANALIKRVSDKAQEEISILVPGVTKVKDIKVVNKGVIKDLLTVCDSPQQLVESVKESDPIFNSVVVIHLKIHLNTLIDPPPKKPKSKVTRFVSAVGKALSKPFRMCIGDTSELQQQQQSLGPLDDMMAAVTWLHINAGLLRGKVAEPSMLSNQKMEQQEVLERTVFSNDSDMTSQQRISCCLFSITIRIWTSSRRMADEQDFRICCMFLGRWDDDTHRSPVQPGLALPSSSIFTLQLSSLQFLFTVR
ncbi:uncharacterized protein LOC122999569 [Thunnus albacares]|uniref:uncharacterized protein LOC122999569 n=1 Tax=Thunnus albacares TaxID=8236 RepID=UPI001CF6B4A5|nr:uncharacterized protein LOC122999569 [Thunnus albacares]XP_044232518.1 uncharacterized protein LOC122999569 [Thunnus albacares]XP_044232519.1 uncharacterized protein LOC122999569 [Thunnus albacares]